MFKDSLESKSTQPVSIFSLALTPIGCLIRSPLLFLLVLLIVGGSIVILTDAFPVNLLNGGPDFSDLTFLENFDLIQSKNSQTWKIEYEKSFDSSFQGLVRHASPIRLSNYPLLSHDILVTTGDFSNPDRVSTSVDNHKFSWYSKNSNRPLGSINLLHTVPINQEILEKLRSVKKGTMLSISGREILKINILDAQKKITGYWQDAGCNTILVKSITTNQ